MNLTETNDWYEIVGDCRVPAGYLITALQATYLVLPHRCTEEQPCPTRRLGL